MATRARRTVLLVLPFLLALMLISPSAPAIGTCVTPPEITPLQDLTPGTTGTAWTVVQGTTPVSFDVEVLATLTGEPRPGKSLVLIETSGPVIDATGGIAAGMSGSPVYVGGKLAGAISYGFGSGTDHTLGVMTPAADMINIISYPDPAAPLTIEISEQERRLVARAADQNLASIGGSLEPITVPVAVSGLSQQRLRSLERQLEGHAGPIHLFASGSIAAPTPAAAPPMAAGDSMAAVLSYGDVSAGGIGTATAVCGDQVMGWGHPFFWDGQTELGMAGADITMVMTDPSEVWGPSKVGSITDSVGIIDQDRLSGIRGVEGTLPSVIPITSHIEDDDLGTSRDGQTDVVLPTVIPDIAASHVLGNVDAVIDRIGPGTGTLDWQIQGLDPDGNQFDFSWGDSYYSGWDVGEGSLWDFYEQLARISTFPDAEVTSVDVSGSFTEAELRSEIVDVWAGTPARPNLRPRGTLHVRPGDKISLRVFLQPAEGPQTNVDITYKVPRWARGSGPLLVHGGEEEGYGYYYYGPQTRASDEPETFGEMLASYDAEVRNSDIVVSLFPTRKSALHERTYRQTQVVSGEHEMWVVLG